MINHFTDYSHLTFEYNVIILFGRKLQINESFMTKGTYET